MVTVSERKISEIRAYVTDSGIECVPVYNFAGSGDSDPSVLFNNQWLWAISESVFNNGPLNFKTGVSGASVTGIPSTDSSYLAPLSIGGSTSAGNFASIYAFLISSTNPQLLVAAADFDYNFSCYVDRLSTGEGDDFRVEIGWKEDRLGTLGSDCMMLTYEPLDSANWLLRNGSGSVYDVVDTGVPVVANQKYNIRLRTRDIEGTYTSEIYIGGSLVASSSERIPTRTLGLVHMMRSVDGGTDKNLVMVDYAQLTIRR